MSCGLHPQWVHSAADCPFCAHGLAGAVSAEPPAWQDLALSLIEDVKLIADYADRNTFYGPADAFRDSIAWAVKHAALLTAELAALRAESRETPDKDKP